MTWVRTEDSMPLHPKILRLSDGAYRLWSHGLHFANRATTDGVIAKDLVATLNHHNRWTAKQIAAFVAELVTFAPPHTSGLWIDEGTCYRIHDYEKHQAEAMTDRVEERRAYERDKKARQRSNSYPARVPVGVPTGVPGVSALPTRPVPSPSLGEGGDVSPRLLLTSGDSGKPKRPRATKPSRHDQAMADTRVVEALEFYRELHAKDHRWKPETKEGSRTRAEHVLCALVGDGRDEMTLDEVRLAIQGNHADRWHADISKHELSYVLRADKVAAFVAAGSALAPRQGAQSGAGATSPVSEIESRLRAAREHKDAVAGTDDAKAAMDVVRAIQLELARANERRGAA
jgi:hypothetical protein